MFTPELSVSRTVCSLHALFMPAEANGALSPVYEEIRSCSLSKLNICLVLFSPHAIDCESHLEHGICVCVCLCSLWKGDRFKKRVYESVKHLTILNRNIPPSVALIKETACGMRLKWLKFQSTLLFSLAHIGGVTVQTWRVIPRPPSLGTHMGKWLLFNNLSNSRSFKASSYLQCQICCHSSFQILHDTRHSFLEDNVC